MADCCWHCFVRIADGVALPAFIDVGKSRRRRLRICCSCLGRTHDPAWLSFGRRGSQIFAWFGASGTDELKVMHLYETHLPVQSTEAAQRFYVDVVGLQFAYRDPGRDIVFLWIGAGRSSMLGLWGPTTTRGNRPHSCHFAIALPLAELLLVGKRLNDLGVSTRNFMDEETTEPSVIGWMPSAQLYFRDPDGHSVEFISLLDDAPDPTFIGSLSAWENGA